jgi:hypothetical protein
MHEVSGAVYTQAQQHIKLEIRPFLLTSAIKLYPSMGSTIHVGSLVNSKLLPFSAVLSYIIMISI